MAAGWFDRFGRHIRECSSCRLGLLVSAAGRIVAANAKLSLQVITGLAALLGLYHGYLNGTGLGLSGTSAAVILGLIFAVFVLVALAAALVVQLRASWARITVRVAGSWIAASGLLMLGWAVRQG